MRDLEKSKRLHKKALAEAKVVIDSGNSMLKTLIEVQADRTFELFERTFLTPYCVDILGLPEEVAKCYVRVVKKSLEVPELGQSVISGEVCVYKAKVISSVITAENKSEWIEKAMTLSKSKLERLISKAKLQTTQPVKLDLKHETVELLKRSQEIQCTRSQAHVTYEDTVHVALEEFVQKHDPVEKAKRSRGSSLKHEVTKRDEERCQYIYEDGSQCEERKWLDRHHNIPRRLGGADTLENVITMCAGHHRMIHRDEEESGDHLRSELPVPPEN